MSATAPSLTDRVAALEQQLAALTNPPDNIQPNYLRVNADGTIGALFTGGVELNEALDEIPNPEKQVTWIDAAGVPRGVLTTWFVAGHHWLVAEAKGDSSVASVVIARDDGLSDFLHPGSPVYSEAGRATLNWGAAGRVSTAETLVLPEAVGSTSLLALPSNITSAGVYQDEAVLNWGDNGNGSVSVYAATRSGASVAAGSKCTLAYLLWGT